MGYLFTTNQYMEVTVSAVTYPFTMACWLYCTSNAVDNKYALTLVDKTSSQINAGIYAFNDGLVYGVVRGATANDGNDLKAAYASATWTPVILVAHSAINRDIYVGAGTDNSIVDTGALSGLTTLVVGAEWDAVPSGPQNFFEGKVAEPVLARGEEWDGTARAAYIAGTQTHLISGVTPDLYKNLMQDAASPDGNGSYGTAFTLVVAPTLTDHPAVLTGQNKKQLTVTGTHAQVVAAMATLQYTPDSAYEGQDLLTTTATDAGSRSDTAQTTIVVESGANPPPLGTWQVNYSMGLHF